jgi:hypothetical protein
VSFWATTQRLRIPDQSRCNFPKNAIACGICVRLTEQGFGCDKAIPVAKQKAPKGIEFYAFWVSKDAAKAALVPFSV